MIRMYRIGTIFSISIFLLMYCLEAPLDPLQNPENARSDLQLLSSSGERNSTVIEDSVSENVTMRIIPVLNHLIDSITVKITGGSLDTGVTFIGDTIRSDTIPLIYNFLMPGSFKIYVYTYKQKGFISIDSGLIVIHGDPVQAPYISKEPQDVSVIEGQQIVLSLTAYSSKPLCYLWYKDTFALEEQTDSVLVITASLEDSGTYYCEVYNDLGLVKSEHVTVTVAPELKVAPIILDQSGHTSVAPGGSVLLYVEAKGSEPLFFLWLKSGDTLFAEIDDTLRIASAVLSDSGYYQVLVFNHVDTVQSDVIHLSVTENVHQITVSVIGNGSVRPGGKNSIFFASAGEDKEFLFHPDTGYHINVVLIDGEENAGAAESGVYVFENIGGDHTLSVEFQINSYFLQVESENGLVSIVPQKDNYVHGSEVTISADADSGYYFSGWGGDIQGTINPLSIRVLSDLSIAANFTELGKFSINISSRNGSVLRSPDGVSYNYGASVQLSPIPDEGYYFLGWTGDTVTNDSTITLKLLENIHIEALFSKKTYNIEIQSGAGGVVSPSGSLTVTHGDSLEITITADSLYHVQDVTLDGVSMGVVEKHFLRDISANHLLCATFAPDTFTINALAGEGGTILPDGTILATTGMSKGFKISPSSGKEIKAVYVDGDSVGVVDTFTFQNIQADHTIEAVFKTQSFTVTTNASSHGRIDPDGPLEVALGDSLYFKLVADSFYHVEDLIIDGISVGPRLEYTIRNINRHLSIEAIFVPDTFTVTVTGNEGGTMLPDGQKKVITGETVGIKIFPDEGKYIDSLFIDNELVGINDTFTFENIRANHSIRVIFATQLFTISASAGEYGSISPTGYDSVAYGEQRTFTITADPHYLIGTVTVDGQPVYIEENVYEYTFSNIRADHTIDVQFTAIMHTITTTAGPGGQITPAGPLLVPEGQEKVFHIIPDLDYMVYDVKIQGVSVGAVDSFVFEVVLHDSSIEAVFMPKPVAHWSFDSVGENVYYDVSENGYDAVDSEETGLPIVPGVKGNALHLATDSFRVSVPDSRSQFNYDQLSIAVWFNSDSILSTSHGWEHAKNIVHYSSVWHGISLCVLWDGYSYLFLREMSVDSSTIDTWVECNTTLLPQTWYFMVATYEDHVVKTYINGELKNMEQVGDFVAPTDYDLHLGMSGIHHPQVYPNRFKGKLDEIRIYNKVLTPEQIKAEYDSLRP